MEDEPKQLHEMVIMRGLPGSGKSSQIDKLTDNVDDELFEICSADYYFYGEDGEYVFDGSKLGEAHAWCFKRCIGAMHKGTFRVYIDNTNTSALEIAPYYLAAQAYGYRVVIYEMLRDFDDCVRDNIHGVEQKTILNMQKRLFEPLPPYWEYWHFETSLDSDASTRVR